MIIDDNSVLVIGAGGHAKVCVDVIASSGYRIHGCVSNKKDNVMENITMLYGDQHISLEAKRGVRKAFVAIGDNFLRWKLQSLCVENGYELITVISHTSHVAKNAFVGAGSIVMPGAIITASAVVGDSTIINTASVVEHDCIVGNAVHIAPRTVLAGSVSVGDFTMIGVGSCVKPKINIGINTIIGAGSVVVKDIPDHAKAYGNPAKIHGVAK